MKTFRHELKYYMNQGEAMLLDKRLSMTMDLDPHAQQRPDGQYHIRSLYFDDVVNSALKDKLDGIEQRRKFRIRIYNLSDEDIFFECKEKVGPYIAKSSMPISRELCDELCAGEYRRLLHMDHPLAGELYYRMSCRRLRPTVIVDYMRTPYVADYQKIRITFDRDIRTGVYATDLFDPYLPTIPALEDRDLVLEVKFNEYLPAYYHGLIQTTTSMRSAVSKYVMCRKFE